MRCLGIDYGTRRIGLSYGDELGVATPLPALTEADAAARWASLLEVARRRRVTDLVVGHPLNMDDTPGPKAREAEAFAARLGGELGLPVHLVDERLTSHLLSHDLESLLQDLPHQEAELLRLRYGINQEAPMTLSAVARSMGVTRDTAQIGRAHV